MIDTLSTAFGLYRTLRHLVFLEGLLLRQGWRVHFCISVGTVVACVFLRLSVLPVRILLRPQIFQRWSRSDPSVRAL